MDLLASYSNPNAQLTEVRKRLTSLIRGQPKRDGVGSAEQAPGRVHGRGAAPGPRSGHEIVVRVVETWEIDDDRTVLVSSEVVAILQVRVGGGWLETWLASSRGRLVAFVANTERAMVMLIAEEGDPGEHAVDPRAEGMSGGFVLSNGQHDEYLNKDTVPFDEALRIVEYIVGNGSWPSDVHWVIDR